MNILKATALSLALTLSGFAFAGETIDKLKETKTITFGSRDTSVPYSYADAQGRYVAIARTWVWSSKDSLKRNTTWT